MYFSVGIPYTKLPKAMEADLYRCWVDVASNLIRVWSGFRCATRVQAKRFKRIGDYYIIELDVGNIILSLKKTGSGNCLLKYPLTRFL
jgi:hypothetical protein